MRAQSAGAEGNACERGPLGSWETNANAVRRGVGKRMRVQPAGELGNACERSMLDPTAPDRSDLLCLHHASSRVHVLLEAVQSDAHNSLHVVRHVLFRSGDLVEAAIREVVRLTREGGGGNEEASRDPCCLFIHLLFFVCLRC